MTSQNINCHPPDKLIEGGDLSPVYAYDNIVRLDSLMRAFRKARRGKRSQNRFYIFEMYEGIYLRQLYKSLKRRTYQPRPPFVFEIYCQSGRKTRIISSPRIPDTIVQHAIYRHIYKLFSDSFIFDSYGCLIGKGTHRASVRCQQFMRRSPADSYYLQLDIRRFYYNINHDILRAALSRKIKDPDTVNLIMMQCDNGSDVGLNVGAMISQLMGAIYLDKLDNYIKRVLKVKHYIRYVDDMVLIGLTKEECHELRDKLRDYIEREFHLTFSKDIIQPLRRGINFVGFRTWQDKRLVRKYSLRNFNRSLKSKNIKSLQSIMGHARNTASYPYMLRRACSELDVSDIQQFRGVCLHDLLKQKNHN